MDRRSITETNQLLITGSTCNLLTPSSGVWSYTWQETDQTIYPSNLTNKAIVESFRTHLGSTKIVYLNGSSFDQLDDFYDLLNAAKNARLILVCFGENAYTETLGNINDLTLDNAQLQLVIAMKNRTDIRITKVLVLGRARIIRPIVDASSAILMAYLPGM